MSRQTLRLTLDVTYETNGEHPSFLADCLLHLATRAMREGLLTDGSDAEVVVANPSVEILE